MPEGTRLSPRGIFLMFALGLSDVCRHAFKVLHEGCVEANVVYNDVVSLLVTARQPLPISTFTASDDEVCTVEVIM